MKEVDEILNLLKDGQEKWVKNLPSGAIKDGVLRDEIFDIKSRQISTKKNFHKWISDILYEELEWKNLDWENYCHGHISQGRYPILKDYSEIKHPAIASNYLTNIVSLFCKPLISKKFPFGSEISFISISKKDILEEEFTTQENYGFNGQLLRQLIYKTINESASYKNHLQEYEDILLKISQTDKVLATKYLLHDQTKIIADMISISNIISDDFQVLNKKNNIIKKLDEDTNNHNYLAEVKFHGSGIVGANRLSENILKIPKYIRNIQDNIHSNPDKANSLKHLIDMYTEEFPESFKEEFLSGINLKIMQKAKKKLSTKEDKQSGIEHEHFQKKKRYLKPDDNGMVDKYPTLKGISENKISLLLEGAYGIFKWGIEELIEYFTTDKKMSEFSLNYLDTVRKAPYNPNVLDKIYIELPSSGIENYFSETEDCLTKKEKFLEQGNNINRNLYSNFININAYEYYTLPKTTDREDFTEYIFNLDEFKYGFNMGRAIVLDSIIGTDESLYVAGFSGTELLHLHNKWKEPLYEAIINYARANNSPNIFFDLNPLGRNTQSYFSHEWAAFIAEKCGLEKDKDYTFTWEGRKFSGTPVFKLINPEWQNIKLKRSDNVTGTFFLEGVMQQPKHKEGTPDMVYDKGYVIGKYIPLEELK